MLFASSKSERLLEQHNISVLKPNDDFLFAVALVFDYKYGFASRISFRRRQISRYTSDSYTDDCQELPPIHIHNNR